MNLQEYFLAKKRRFEQAWQPRSCCTKCKNPTLLCYCEKICPFVSELTFVILIHRGEARRTIATGRMAHLILSNSRLIEGLNYTDDECVNGLIEDPEYFPVVLFPGREAINLSKVDSAQRRALFPEEKRPLIFILDGTWNHAKRMRRLSRNLSNLPTIKFTPRTPSNFRVRKQPNESCYSTIEAIHELSRLMEYDSKASRDNLIDVFDFMVEKQIGYRREKDPSSELR